MPAKSKKQLKLMFAIANDKKGKIKGGPSKSVAEEMIKATSDSRKRKLMKSK